MLTITRSAQFKKDYKRCIKEQRNIAVLLNVIKILFQEKELPRDRMDSSLSAGRMKVTECHLSSDWILIYRIEKSRLFLIRTGTHSEIYCV